MHRVGRQCLLGTAVFVRSCAMELSLKYEGGVSGRTQISRRSDDIFRPRKDLVCLAALQRNRSSKARVRPERLQSLYRETESWKPWYSGKPPSITTSLRELARLYTTLP